MNYSVYVLYSASSCKHYTGSTSDLEKRFISHNELGHGWTANYRPWKLIYQKTFDMKTKALEFEKWLKTGAGRDFIKTLPH